MLKGNQQEIFVNPLYLHLRNIEKIELEFSKFFSPSVPILYHFNICY